MSKQTLNDVGSLKFSLPIINQTQDFLPLGREWFPALG